MQLGLVAGRKLADHYLPGVEKEKAFAVRRELGRPLAARPRGQLARWLVGAWLVERDAPKVVLAGYRPAENQIAAIGADTTRVGGHLGRRQEAQASLDTL